MKNLFTIVIAIFLFANITKAQDTMYVHQKDGQILKVATAKIDSITFNNVPEIDDTTGIIFNPNLVYGIVTDCEGHNYKTITIGTQTWMAENLKTKKYCNGDLIETTADSIPNDTTSKYQWAYNNDENNVVTYGRLYTWYTATDLRGICPTDWHVPTNTEWLTLVNYLGGSAGGGKLKETDTTHWTSPNTGASNESGFTVLPSGVRYNPESFRELGDICRWWFSTEYPYNTTNAYGSIHISNYGNVNRVENPKHYGFAVRCIKD